MRHEHGKVGLLGSGNMLTFAYLNCRRLADSGDAAADYKLSSQ